MIRLKPLKDRHGVVGYETEDKAFQIYRQQWSIPERSTSWFVHPAELKWQSGREFYTLADARAWLVEHYAKSAVAMFKERKV